MTRLPEPGRKPEPIFNGHDLNGWEPIPATAKNNWVAEDGDLVNTAHGANIKTTRKFEDFKLHIEFNCPEDGNSGIYLRGRYEVQVEYEKVDANDRFHSIGAIYGFLAPEIELPRKPGTWESFDITLVGRYVTIVRDGKSRRSTTGKSPASPAERWIRMRASRVLSTSRATTRAG